MTSNNQFTPIEHMLHAFTFGKITITQYLTVYCDGDTCREWQPLADQAFYASPWESCEAYEAKFEYLVTLEEESRICQGHLVQHEKLRGMLRSFSYKPESEDRSRQGSLSITVLPWDDKEQRLTRSRVIRARVFDYTNRECSVYVIDNFGAKALDIDLRQWRPDGTRS
jgi:hypothetical protein